MRRVLSRRPGTVIFTGLAILLLALATYPGLGPRVRYDRLPARGEPYFWAGVNYPWKSYQDFGTGAWGHSGVSNPVTYDEIDTDFANMAAQGIRVAKWRVFSDGRYAPTFDEAGFATGLAPEFYADVKAALEIAERHDIYLVFTLFNSQLWTTSCERDGVHFGWGPAEITDPARRAALLHNGVEPFLRLIASSDRVLAVEVIAEPEWGIAELHTEQNYRLKVPLTAARSFVRDVLRAVRANTRALATVEANRPSYMQYWRGLGLDYYSFSWYDWMAPYDPLEVPAKSHGLDAPVVLGEFPVATSEYYDLEKAMDIALANGYAGAFAWSFAAADKYSQWENVREGFTSWLQRRWPEVALATGVPEPKANAPVIPPPFARSTTRFHVEQGILVADVDLYVRGGGDLVAKFFLYPGDKPSQQALAEREHVIAVPEGRPELLSAIFDGLSDGQQYKLSLGIFDRHYSLVKWFDGLAIFSMDSGKVEQPEPTQEQIENPCYGITG